jgi:hypothetical protein
LVEAKAEFRQHEHDVDHTKYIGPYVHKRASELILKILYVDGQQFKNIVIGGENGNVRLHFDKRSEK